MRRHPTPPEQTLWAALRNDALGGWKFRRQQLIGRYIVDFYCSKAALVVEVDGASHIADDRDAARDAWLATQGLRVVRFWNNEVMGNLPGVLTTILAAATTPPPTPSHKGRGLSPRRDMFRRSPPP